MALPFVPPRPSSPTDHDLNQPSFLLPWRPPQHTPSLTRLRALLRQPLRVHITDARIFLGTFAGTDKQLNIVLINTEEFRMGDDDETPEGRYVGQVMIPWRFVVKVEAQQKEEPELRTTTTDYDMYL
ncbi:hypothetical protein BDQ12DRAFT_630416 [Crucibulum laeve]|uniref:Sm domain-containing protein n=1 Tax=Crucibulum laeve TaxID=68775 RepID=A0A5C3M0A7_9AGAR|nr:hypothetical protein BDQ12DRAFT_630416 [Crucibulum laeve]